MRVRKGKVSRGNSPFYEMIKEILLFFLDFQARYPLHSFPSIIIAGSGSVPGGISRTRGYPFHSVRQGFSIK